MFDLSDIVIDNIIFAMEDQGNDYFIDVETGEVFSENDEDRDWEQKDNESESSYYESVPSWTSRAGFELMGCFADTVSNPMIRGELKAVLARGRRVFRGFKDVLDQDNQLLERWYEFKRLSMKRTIAAWYALACEARGLAKLGPEPEDIADLVQSDYTIRRYGADACERLAPLFEAAFVDALERFPAPLVGYEQNRLEAELAAGKREGLRIVAAESAAGEADAAALARTVFVADRSFCRLLSLYVMPERRTLGLGKTLIEALAAWCRDDGIVLFIVDLPFLGDGFGKTLEQSGYLPFGTRYIASHDE